MYRLLLTFIICHVLMLPLHAAKEHPLATDLNLLKIEVNSESFPELPGNQWAYEAIEKLKENGILTGYTDGMYKGARIASRYEIAHAIYAAWTKLKGMIDGLESQISSLNEKINSDGNVAAEVKDLNSQIETLQYELAGMKTYGEDIVNLKKLVHTFQTELKQMGADIKNMQEELTLFEAKIKKLEDKRYTVAISGDTVTLLIAGHGSRFADKNTYGITSQGRLTGVGRGSDAPFDQNGNIIHPNAEPVGMNQDVSVFNEIALTFNSTDQIGPFKWHGTVVAGNTLSDLGPIPSYAALGDQNSGLFGYAFKEFPMDAYLQDINFIWKNNWKNGSLEINIGRVRYMVSRYIFQKGDNNEPYFPHSRWQSPKHLFDGGLIKLGFGENKTELDIFGGQSQSLKSVHGVVIDPIDIIQPVTDPDAQFVYPTPENYGTNVNQLLGAHLIVPFKEKSKLSLAYILFDANTPLLNAIPSGRSINRMAVYGGTLDYQLSNAFFFEGGYSRQPYMNNMDTVYNNDTGAAHGHLSFYSGVYDLAVGYKYIEKNYNAPGDWESIGLYQPQDVKGPNIRAGMTLDNKWDLYGYAEFWQGISPATSHHRYFDYMIEAKYHVRPNWWWKFKFKGANFNRRDGTPIIRQYFPYVMTCYELNRRSMMYFGYQFGHSDNMRTQFLGLTSPFFNQPFQGGYFWWHFMYTF